MYRARPWTIRQVAGFGTAEDTNGRYKYLLAHGETGLSTDFDLPTLLGYDSDHPVAVPEIGKIGVAVDTIDDVRLLMKDIPLDEVSTSYTINASAFVLIGMYEVVAKEQGVADKITGTCQNDILKEYTAQNEYIYPPAQAVKLVVDTMEYAAKTMPRYNPVSVSGYHIRDAGSNAVQELAFTLAAAHCYVTEAVKRGLSADFVAPRVSFFWNIQNDFFEEICKLRAARRLWARMMRDWVGAKDPRSWMMRAHAQTSGVSLDRPAAGQQHRAHGRPGAGRHSGRHAVAAHQLEGRGVPDSLGGRDQDRRAHAADPRAREPDHRRGRSAGRLLLRRAPHGPPGRRSGIADPPDPRSRRHGALDRGRLHPAADRRLRRPLTSSALEAQEEYMVGVNIHVDEESELPFEPFELDPDLAARQIKRTQAVRKNRSQAEVGSSLKEIRQAAVSEQNVMPAWCARSRRRRRSARCATCLREVFGDYRAPIIF